jgi:hypothetical protein
MHVSLTYPRVKGDGSYVLIVREESQPGLKLQPVSQKNVCEALQYDPKRGFDEQ